MGLTRSPGPVYRVDVWESPPWTDEALMDPGAMHAARPEREPGWHARFRAEDLPAGMAPPHAFGCSSREAALAWLAELGRTRGLGGKMRVA